MFFENDYDEWIEIIQLLVNITLEVSDNNSDNLKDRSFFIESPYIIYQSTNDKTYFGIYDREKKEFTKYNKDDNILIPVIVNTKFHSFYRQYYSKDLYKSIKRYIV
jgi:hypothetical protein